LINLIIVIIQSKNKMFSIILISIALISINCNVDKFSDCKCKGDAEPILFFKDKNDNKLIVCGNFEKKITDNKFVVSEFIIYECMNEKEVINYSEDATFKSVITIEKDSVIITETHYILNNNWEIDITPAKETVIKFVNDEAVITSEKQAFVVPPLTKEQTDSLFILNKNLIEKAKGEKIHYPYDEKTIYLLFMGAINGNQDAKYLLRNLGELFILDGAIAETLGEIWVSF